MTLIFMVCTRCGRLVEDPETLAAARQAPWNCPACGAQNSPLRSCTEKRDLYEKDSRNRDEEVPVTSDSRGLSDKGRPLYFPTAEIR